MTEMQVNTKSQNKNRELDIDVTELESLLWSEDIIENELVYLSQLDHVNETLNDIWEHVLDFANHHSDNMVTFPYHLIRKQLSEMNEVYARTYNECNIRQSFKKRLKETEVEIYALESGFHIISNYVPKQEWEQVHQIFVALRVLFKEFKQDKLEDASSRLGFFVTLVESLIEELNADSKHLKNTNSNIIAIKSRR